MDKLCPKCNEAMEAGIATAHGLIGGPMIPKNVPRLIFTVLGAPTSWNPLTALKQGLANEPADADYWIKGLRCSGCGFLELFAEEKA
jgi:hypothetical protein